MVKSKTSDESDVKACCEHSRVGSNEMVDQASEDVFQQKSPHLVPNVYQHIL